MTEYQEAERETSRIEEALESEYGVGSAEERSTKRILKLYLIAPGLLLLKVKTRKGLRL